MARIDVPIKVQLGCDECHRFLIAQLGEHKRVREALAELVRLKDGPRDDAYRAEKDAAWDAGRAALASRETLAPEEGNHG